MKIAIIGAGNMGKWLVEELCLNHEVAVFDATHSRMKYLFNAHRLMNIKDIESFNPDMLINAVSLQYTYQAFEDVLPFLNKSCILVDIASVKNGLKKFYEEKNFRFISVHPMFGPTFANLRDLSSHNAIIITESDEEGKKFFRAFFHSLKLKIYEYSFEEHDRTIGYSLSLPFITTLLFASCMKEIEAPGTTLKKHMDIAKGLFSENDYLISEILFNPHTQEHLDKLKFQIDLVSDMLNNRKTTELHNFFNTLRGNIAEKKS